MNKEQSFPCPCCGYLTKDEEMIGTYEICPVCFWQDDDIQFREPDYAGGANIGSLNEARQNYRKYGATEKRFINHVRQPYEDEIPKNLD